MSHDTHSQSIWGSETREAWSSAKVTRPKRGQSCNLSLGSPLQVPPPGPHRKLKSMEPRREEEEKQVKEVASELAVASG